MRVHNLVPGVRITLVQRKVARIRIKLVASLDGNEMTGTDRI